MMFEIKIDNIIASTNIGNVNLEELHEQLDDSVLNYTASEEEDEGSIPLSLLWNNDNGIALILFNTGRLLSVQGTTIEEVEDSINDFVGLLSDLGFLEQ